MGYDDGSKVTSCEVGGAAGCGAGDRAGCGAGCRARCGAGCGACCGEEGKGEKMEGLVTGRNNLLNQGYKALIWMKSLIKQ